MGVAQVILSINILNTRVGTVPITAVIQRNGIDYVTGSKSFTGGSSGVITLQVSRGCGV